MSLFSVIRLCTILDIAFGASVLPGFGGRAAEDGDDVFDRDHEQYVVGFEVDRNGVLGMEQDLVVLADREIDVPFDLGADLHHAAGDGRNLRLVGKNNAAARLMTAFVFPNQNPLSERFDKIPKNLTPNPPIAGNVLNGEQSRRDGPLEL